MDNNFDEGRRKTLKFLAGGAVAVGVWSSHKIDHLLSPEINRYLENLIHCKLVDVFGASEEVKTTFAELFLGTQEKVYLIPAQHNPNVLPNLRRLAEDPYEVFTHTTLGAARSFASVLDILEDRIKRIDELISLSGEGNLVTFGSPTSNIIARTALGYAEIGNGKMGAEYYPCDAMHPKILYELNGHKILATESRHCATTRRVNGQDNVIPNWGVNRNGVLMLPETNDGVLIQDYLVISSLPNIFNLSSFDAGHRIINFGGTHREGTEAIGRLIYDARLLEDLKSKLSELKGQKGTYPYWQALVLVDCDPRNKGVIPKKVLDVQEVEVNKPLLRRLVTKNFTELKRL